MVEWLSELQDCSSSRGRGGGSRASHAHYGWHACCSSDLGVATTDMLAVIIGWCNNVTTGHKLSTYSIYIEQLYPSMSLPLAPDKEFHSWLSGACSVMQCDVMYIDGRLSPVDDGGNRQLT
jgi:hypothetical protein